MNGLTQQHINLAIDALKDAARVRVLRGWRVFDTIDVIFRAEEYRYSPYRRGAAEMATVALKYAAPRRVRGRRSGRARYWDQTAWFSRAARNMEAKL